MEEGTDSHILNSLKPKEVESDGAPRHQRRGPLLLSRQTDFHPCHHRLPPSKLPASSSRSPSPSHRPLATFSLSPALLPGITAEGRKTPGFGSSSFADGSSLGSSSSADGSSLGSIPSPHVKPELLDGPSCSRGSSRVWLPGSSRSPSPSRHLFSLPPSLQFTPQPLPTEFQLLPNFASDPITPGGDETLLRLHPSSNG